MIWPYSFGRSRERAPALIDSWLPEGAYLLEYHSIDLPTAGEQALHLALDLSLDVLPFVRALFLMRGIPHRADMTLREMFSTKPFLVLKEEGNELVFGIVGPFWGIRRGHLPRDLPRSPEEFRGATKERMAAIANFRVDSILGGSRIWTETWASTPHMPGKALFTIYWLVIGPWSAWIRRMFLNAARKRVVLDQR